MYSAKQRADGFGGSELIVFEYRAFVPSGASMYEIPMPESFNSQSSGTTNSQRPISAIGMTAVGGFWGATFELLIRRRRQEIKPGLARICRVRPGLVACR